MTKLVKHIIAKCKRLTAGGVLALLMVLCNPFAGNNAFAQNEFTQKDRELLIEVKVTMQEMDKRINERFAEIDKRFEQVDKRFEQVDKRFEQITNFMWMLVVIFVGIVAVTIGFALWDRRTMIRPFETKVKEIEKELGTKMSRIDGVKVEKLITSLKEFANGQPKLAEILKVNGLI